MARQRLFTSYVADRFYNELFAAINDYAETNSDNLNLRLYKVNKIGGIELSGITVKFKLLLMRNLMFEKLIIIMILTNLQANGLC